MKATKQQIKSKLQEPNKQKTQQLKIVKQNELNQFGRPKQNVIFFQLTKEMVEQAAQIIEKDHAFLPDNMYDEARNKSDKVWDKFYKNHKCNFFKDRTYLERQIKEITYMRQKFKKDGNMSTFCEMGCGVGNTLFPLLRDYEFMKLLGCDISENAIKLIQKEMDNHEQLKNRLNVKVCDLVKDQIPFESKPDLISMIFVLSAIVPQQHEKVLKKIVTWMKPGSFFYFRDYGRYDFGQLNMAKKGNRKLGQNFYMKNDGVCVYYFQQEQLQKMLEKIGLVKIEGGIHCRLLQNRKIGLKMYRVWVQARFYKPPLDNFYLQKLRQQKQKNYDKVQENKAELQNAQKLFKQQQKEIKKSTQSKEDKKTVLNKKQS